MSLSIAIIILTTIATLITLWWEYASKKDKKNVSKEIISTIFILLLVLLNYNQSKIDKEISTIEKEKDAIRYQKQYDSLVSVIEIARKTRSIADSSFSYLRLVTEKEKERRITDHEYSLKNAVGLIVRRYESMLFQSSDDKTYLQNINRAINDISDIVSDIKTNPILTSNPIVYKYYNALDSSLVDLRLLSSGYGLESTQQIREAFTKKIGKFCDFIVRYSSDTNANYKYQTLTKQDHLKIKSTIKENSMRFN